MRTDAEIRACYSIYLDENNIIIINWLKGIKEPAEENTRMAELTKQDIQAILATDPEKQFKFLVDLTPMKDKGWMTKEARSIYMSIGENKQIKKFGMVAKNTFWKTILDMMIAASGKGSRMKAFLKREEAIKWLKE
jgi:hypothetical protein